MQAKIISSIIGLFAFFNIQCVLASVTIPMYLIDAQGQGKSIGSVTAENSTCGVLLTPHLHDLPPGVHGFHIHEKSSCGDKGMAAGGHFDPAHTEKHNGPYAK